MRTFVPSSDWRITTTLRPANRPWSTSATLPGLKTVDSSAKVSTAAHLLNSDDASSLLGIVEVSWCGRMGRASRCRNSAGA